MCISLMSCALFAMTFLIVEIPGTDTPDEIVIIGAHYDSRTGMKDKKGRGMRFKRTLSLVAWVNEEFL